MAETDIVFSSRQGLEIREVALEQVICKGSRYGFSLAADRLFATDQGLGERRAALWRSLDGSGIVMPLLARQHGGGLHLVDGFKRFAWAAERGLSALNLALLPDGMDELQTALFLAQNHACLLNGSVAARALFLGFCQGLGLRKEVVARKLLPAMDLSPSRKLLERYLSISALPDAALSFAAEKRLSFRRCLNLTAYPSETLDWLMDNRGRLRLTASICEEILDCITELMKRRGCGLETLLSEEALSEILEDQSLSDSERTALVRRKLDRLRRPVSSEVNQELDAMKRGLEQAATGLEVEWDRSLEQDHITLRIAVTAPEQLDNLLKALADGKARKGIVDMLERLRA